MPLTVAIVGRPNVGKSTLFNRLAGRRLAIVDDAAGTTRDRSAAESNLAGLALRIVDTAGFEEGPPESMSARMLAQTRAAVARADVCLFLIDAREGVTPGDEIVAQALRRSGKPVILAANKCEGAGAISGHGEAHGLGFGEPIALSAEHGLGLADLAEALAPYAEAQPGDAEMPAEETSDGRPLRLAIVGRPNVGKSSLLNRLIGEDRALVSPEAGTTRDAVAAEWMWKGRRVLLHDTAGLRRKFKMSERLEKLSAGSTHNAVRFADCVVVVIDATAPFERQELAIAGQVAQEGRAIVFAVNKWDLVQDRRGALARLRETADRLLPQSAGAPLVALSALTGEGVERLMAAVMEADKVWNTRVPTAALNRFLAEAVERHPPPAVKGRRVRIRYMTQAKARPPSFVLFGNQLKALPESYLRYLVNAMREAFRLPGTPIRLMLRTSKNPYAEK